MDELPTSSVTQRSSDVKCDSAFAESPRFAHSRSGRHKPSRPRRSEAAHPWACGRASAAELSLGRGASLRGRQAARARSPLCAFLALLLLAPVPAGAADAGEAPPKNPVAGQESPAAEGTPDPGSEEIQRKLAAPPPSRLRAGDKKTPYSARAPEKLPPERESRLRRTENVFMISLPFTALHAMAIVSVAALLIQDGEFNIGVEYQITGAGLALLGAGFIAWTDSKDTSDLQPAESGVRSTESGVEPPQEAKPEAEGTEREDRSQE